MFNCEKLINFKNRNIVNVDILQTDNIYSSVKKISIFGVLGLLVAGLAGALFGIDAAKAQLEEARYPYFQEMVISAYYSPLPDQEHYSTGSYEGDIRLNGGGVNGADGTPVFPGMIAAPREYPFGFKMKIPGIGVGSVHDRGGAIKGNRIDVWMGFGDEGLQRALNWGKRAVQVEMIGVDESVTESIYLEKYIKAEEVVRKVVQPYKLFKRDLSLGDEGDDVKLLQDSLRKLDLYAGESSGVFDESTRQAVYDFQIMKNIVSSWDDLGAGYCGVQTRAMLELELNGKKSSNAAATINPKDVFFAQTLKRGDSGEDVIILQNELYKLGFLRVAPSGVFDELTEHAVFKFQQKKGILKEKSELGAGIVGPQTRVAMNLVFSDRKKVIAQIKPSNHLQIARVETLKSEKNLAFVQDLNFGDNSNSVGLLQSKLKELGYFEGEVTNFFGEQTHQALVSFQLDQAIINSEADLGAGRVGPKTREVLNQA